MPLVTIYPFMKRITYWPQLVLGLAFNWGALAGWTAVAGGMNWSVTLPLYAAGVSWTLVYDTIYGHQDKRDDVIVGVKSTSLLFGDNTKAILSAFSCSTIGLLQQVNINSPQSCWKTFKSNAWFGGIIFSAILADIVYDHLASSTKDDKTPVD
ncbi:Para-hydroxybenzoate--polyprenyltransferase, mitochondrial precursor (PHB:polyprenyltransferase) [Coemansia sp. RSA 2320]|nr:Para-hydroxybenzoate--polyprenyltransferase, mitochondrial precursor (PHB:polyprenyltransferase) [Coemansia sp. RSA 2320]